MNTEVCAPPSPLEVDPRHAVRAARWIELCGGLVVWESADMGQLGRRWFTPALLTDGSPAQRPHWSCGERPALVITEAAGVEVVERREVRRIRIAARPGYGLGWQLTDASSKRLDALLAEAGADATYTFEGNEAVILGVTSRTPLPRWLAEHPDAKAV
jgi:hypothetical protein